MAIIPVPSLSTLGWVTDLDNKIDLLVSHFFLSDHNQTYMYHGKVISLQRIIEENGNNISGIADDIKSHMTTYLLRYYESAIINVTNNNPDSESGNVSLNIDISISENGVRNTIVRLMESENGKFKKLTKLNNFG